MWRNYNPFINPAQSDEEEYDSPLEEDPSALVSPRRPHQSPSASPRASLRPDPPTVPEVLAGAARQLNDHHNRQERADRRNAVRQAQEVLEEPAVMVDYDAEDGIDGADALTKAVAALRGFAWKKDDLDFYFAQVEIKMQING